jgi:hypothetical protein
MRQNIWNKLSMPVKFSLKKGQQMVLIHLVIQWKKSGVNFINILRTAFTYVDPKRVKKIDNLTVFFTLLRSAWVKAVHKWNVDEIEPRSPVLGRCYMICRNNEVSSSTNFHKQLFLYESFLQSFPLFTVWLCNFFERRILAQKLLAKCWWYWQKESNKIAIQLKIGREIKGN